jgi:DNA mismatch repair protein MutL
VAGAACRAAVKARDRLRLEEIERLVQELGECELPYTCPHGRPTVVLMNYGDLERKFGRA